MCLWTPEFTVTTQAAPDATRISLASSYSKCQYAAAHSQLVLMQLLRFAHSCMDPTVWLRPSAANYPGYPVSLHAWCYNPPGITHFCPPGSSGSNTQVQDTHEQHICMHVRPCHCLLATTNGHGATFFAITCEKGLTPSSRPLMFAYVDERSCA